MATKPTKLPRWATTGTKTEPTEGKKDTGYLVAEKPTAQGWNWLFNNLYEWAAYLDDLGAQTLTWTATHTFQRGVTVTSNVAGSGLTVTGGSSSGAGLSVTGGSTNGRGVLAQGTGSGVGVYGTGGSSGGAASGVHGLGQGSAAGVSGQGGSSGNGLSGVGGATGHGLAANGGSTSGMGADLYGGSSGAFGSADNADSVFLNTGLRARGRGSYAGVYGLGGGTGGQGVYGEGGATNSPGVEGRGKGTGAGGVFTGGSGASAAVELHAGTGWTVDSTTQHALKLVSGHIKMAQGNPSHLIGFTNTLTPSNIVKAWGRCAISTNGGATAYTIGTWDGFNIDTMVVSGQSVVVTFKDDMAGDVNMSIAHGYVGSGTVWTNIQNMTAAGFTIFAGSAQYGAPWGNIGTVASNTVIFQFIVMGDQ